MFVSECVCSYARERVRMYFYVCVGEIERKKARTSVFERLCMSVCVCERERERERDRKE